MIWMMKCICIIYVSINDDDKALGCLMNYYDVPTEQ